MQTEPTPPRALGFSTRISLWFGGLLIAATGLLLLLWYVGLPQFGLAGVRQTLLANATRTLEIEADHLTAGLAARRDAHPGATLDPQSLLGEGRHEHSPGAGRLGLAWWYDAAGRFLIGSAGHAGDAPTGPAPFPTQGPVIGGYSGTRLEWDGQGQAWLAVYRTLRRDAAQGLTLVYAMRQDEVFAGVQGEFDRLAVAGLLFMLPILVLVALVARRLARPLRDLARVAERLGAGDLAARAPLGARDSREMTVLANAINRMATNLQGASSDSRTRWPRGLPNWSQRSAGFMRPWRGWHGPNRSIAPSLPRRPWGSP